MLLHRFCSHAPSSTAIFSTITVNDSALYGQTPRFQSDFSDSALLERYGNSGGVLPHGDPYSALSSFKWQMRVVIPRTSFLAPRRMFIQGRRQWAQSRESLLSCIVHALVMKSWLVTGPPISTFCTNHLWARTAMKARFFESAMNLAPCVMEWRLCGHMSSVDSEALLCRESFLLLSYRALKKRNSVYWQQAVRIDCKTHSRHGIFIG